MCMLERPAYVFLHPFVYEVVYAFVLLYLVEPFFDVVHLVNQLQRQCVKFLVSWLDCTIAGRQVVVRSNDGQNSWVALVFPASPFVLVTLV